jgi:anti-anti-sigma factor
MFSQKKLDENSVVIYPQNALDNSNAREMGEAIEKAQSAGHKYVILNLSGLDFISSAGVGSILGSVQSAREMGGDIILCDVSERIRHTFEILDLCEYLTIATDEQSATQLCLVGGNL